LGPRRPRTQRGAARQGALIEGDRAELRRRRITSVIPEPADQLGHRNLYKGRNVVERAFNLLKNGEGRMKDLHPWQPGTANTP